MPGSDVEIEIVGDLISKPYVDITQAVMQSFGVDMENDSYRRLRVAPASGITAGIRH